MVQELGGNNPVTIRAYYETDKTKGLTVVDKVTANPHVHGCEPIALPSDHIGMCKPPSRESQLYQSMSALLRDILLAPTAITISTTTTAPLTSAHRDPVLIGSGNGVGGAEPSDPPALSRKFLSIFKILQPWRRMIGVLSRKSLRQRAESTRFATANGRRSVSA